MLVGHADAGVHLHGLVGGEDPRLRAAHLGQGDQLRGLRVARIDGAGRRHHGAPAQLDLDEDLGRAVLETLEAPDRGAELHALLQVREGALEGLGHRAQHLGAEPHGGPVHHRLEQRGAASDLSDDGIGAHQGALAAEQGGVARVDPVLPLQRETGRAPLEQEEGDALGVGLVSRGARGHDDRVGHVAVGDLLLLAREAVAVAGPLGPQADAAQVVAAAPLLVG